MPETIIKAKHPVTGEIMQIAVPEGQAPESALQDFFANLDKPSPKGPDQAEIARRATTGGANFVPYADRGNFKERLQQMAGEADKYGFKIGIVSGERTSQKQKELWDKKFASYKAKGMTDEQAYKATKHWVSPPGTSKHEIGEAADLSFNSQKARDWFHQNAHKYGFEFPMGHEPWHIQSIGKKTSSIDEFKKKTGSDITVMDAGAALQAIDNFQREMYKQKQDSLAAADFARQSRIAKAKASPNGADYFNALINEGYGVAEGYTPPDLEAFQAKNDKMGEYTKRKLAPILKAYGFNSYDAWMAAAKDPRTEAYANGAMAKAFETAHKSGAFKSDEYKALIPTPHEIAAKTNDAVQKVVDYFTDNKITEALYGLEPAWNKVLGAKGSSGHAFAMLGYWASTPVNVAGDLSIATHPNATEDDIAGGIANTLLNLNILDPIMALKGASATKAWIKKIAPKMAEFANKTAPGWADVPTALKGLQHEVNRFLEPKRQAQAMTRDLIENTTLGRRGTVFNVAKPSEVGATGEAAASAEANVGSTPTASTKTNTYTVVSAGDQVGYTTDTGWTGTMPKKRFVEVFGKDPVEGKTYEHTTDLASTEPTVQGTAKEPWQMTREEFGLNRPKRAAVKTIVREVSPGKWVVRAVRGTEELGKATFTKTTRGLSLEPASMVYVEPEARRQGIGSTLYEAIESHTGDSVISSGTRTGEGNALWDNPNRSFGHKDYVDDALYNGKPVPPEVLADYPDLAKKYGTPEPTVQGTAEVGVGGAAAEMDSGSSASVAPTGKTPESLDEAHSWVSDYDPFSGEGDKEFASIYEKIMGRKLEGEPDASAKQDVLSQIENLLYKTEGAKIKSEGGKEWGQRILDAIGEQGRGRAKKGEPSRANKNPAIVVKKNSKGIWTKSGTVNMVSLGSVEDRGVAAWLVENFKGHGDDPNVWIDESEFNAAKAVKDNSNMGGRRMSELANLYTPDEIRNGTAKLEEIYLPESYVNRMRQEAKNMLREAELPRDVAKAEQGLQDAAMGTTAADLLQQARDKASSGLRKIAGSGLGSGAGGMYDGLEELAQAAALLVRAGVKSSAGVLAHLVEMTGAKVGDPLHKKLERIVSDIFEGRRSIDGFTQEALRNAGVDVPDNLPGTKWLPHDAPMETGALASAMAKIEAQHGLTTGTIKRTGLTFNEAEQHALQITYNGHVDDAAKLRNELDKAMDKWEVLTGEPRKQAWEQVQKLQDSLDATYREMDKIEEAFVNDGRVKGYQLNALKSSGNSARYSEQAILQRLRMYMKEGDFVSQAHRDWAKELATAYKQANDSYREALGKYRDAKGAKAAQTVMDDLTGGGKPSTGGNKGGSGEPRTIFMSASTYTDKDVEVARKYIGQSIASIFSSIIPLGTGGSGVGGFVFNKGQLRKAMTILISEAIHNGVKSVDDILAHFKSMVPEGKALDESAITSEILDTLQAMHRRARAASAFGEDVLTAGSYGEKGDWIPQFKKDLEELRNEAKTMYEGSNLEEMLRDVNDKIATIKLIDDPAEAKKHVAKLKRMLDAGRETAEDLWVKGGAGVTDPKIIEARQKLDATKWAIDAAIGASALRSTSARIRKLIRANIMTSLLNRSIDYVGHPIRALTDAPINWGARGWDWAWDGLLRRGRRIYGAGITRDMISKSFDGIIRSGLAGTIFKGKLPEEMMGGIGKDMAGRAESVAGVPRKGADKFIEPYYDLAMRLAMASDMQARKSVMQSTLWDLAVREARELAKAPGVVGDAAWIKAKANQLYKTPPDNLIEEVKIRMDDFTFATDNIASNIKTKMIQGAEGWKNKELLTSTGIGQKAAGGIAAVATDVVFSFPRVFFNIADFNAQHMAPYGGVKAAANLFAAWKYGKQGNQLARALAMDRGFKAALRAGYGWFLYSYLGRWLADRDHEATLRGEEGLLDPVRIGSFNPNANILDFGLLENFPGATSALLNGYRQRFLERKLDDEVISPGQFHNLLGYRFKDRPFDKSPSAYEVASQQMMDLFTNVWANQPVATQLKRILKHAETGSPGGSVSYGLSRMLIPGFIRDYATGYDQLTGIQSRKTVYQNEYSSELDNIRRYLQSQIPGFNTELMPQGNQFWYMDKTGKDHPGLTTGGFASVVAPGIAAKKDIVVAELMRLNEMPDIQRRKIKGADGRMHDEPDQAYEERMKKTMQAIYDTLKRHISSPGWKYFTIKERKAKISAIKEEQMAAIKK